MYAQIGKAYEGNGAQGLDGYEVADTMKIEFDRKIPTFSPGYCD